jgi:hypothetical protein
VNSRRRELQRQGDKQASEEAKAAHLEREAARYEEQAGRASSPTMVRSRLQSAQRKRVDANRAREAAAKASKAVAGAQKKLHDAEAALAKESAAQDKRARERELRERRRTDQTRLAEERRQRERERAREFELKALRGRADELEATIRSAPWAHSPAEIDVLFIAASPEDEQALRLDRGVREIQQRVRMSEHRDAVKFHWRLATQVTDLLQALNEVRPHVVHFSGHGNQHALIFEDADGQARPLSNSDLAQLLRISSDRIRLALFNSCHSAEQAALACDHIDAAIGMEQPVDDEAAKIFAGQFYNALGFGKSLREAFEQAAFQLTLATAATSGEPKLYAATGVDPTDVYLVRPTSKEHAA